MMVSFCLMRMIEMFLVCMLWMYLLIWVMIIGVRFLVGLLMRMMCGLFSSEW